VELVEKPYQRTTRPRFGKPIRAVLDEPVSYFFF